MRYILVLLAIPFVAAHGADSEKYLIETFVKIEGRKVSSSKTPVTAGKKHIFAKCEQSGKTRSYILRGRKTEVDPCEKRGDLVDGLEMVAQKEKASAAGKLRVDLKFIGPKVGNSRQKLIVMPGEVTSLMFYNNKGEMVEAKVRARRL